MKKFICVSIISLVAVSSHSLPAQQQIRSGKVAVTSARIRLKYKKYDEALRILEEGRRVEPDYADIYPLLGSLYIRKKEYARADSAFDKAVSLDPKLREDIEAERLRAWSKLVNDGVEAMNQKDFEKAITSLSNATVIYPEGIEAYINLGASYVNASQKDEKWIKDFLVAHGYGDTTRLDSLPSHVLLREALPNFRKALSIDEANFNVMVDLAQVYETLGRPDSAKIYYKNAEAVDPENQSVKAALAACYLREGSVDSASAIYRRLIEADDVDPNVAFNAGLVEFQKGNWPGAEKAFLIALKGNPDDTEALANLSIAMMQQEKYKEVIPYLEKIVELDEENKEAWGSLVVAYAQVGMNDKAEQAHQKYLDLGGD